MLVNWAAALLPTISSRTAGRNIRPWMILNWGSSPSQRGEVPTMAVLVVPPAFLVTSTMMVAWGSAIGLPSGAVLIPGASMISAACWRLIWPM